MEGGAANPPVAVLLPVAARAGAPLLTAALPVVVLRLVAVAARLGRRGVLVAAGALAELVRVRTFWGAAARSSGLESGAPSGPAMGSAAGSSSEGGEGNSGGFNSPVSVALLSVAVSGLSLAAFPKA